MRSNVFFSYSRKDAKWLEQFKTMLAPAVKADALSMWDDSQIQAGQQWREQIARALKSAKVAVLLVRPDLLASQFIRDNELPELLNAAASEELIILWVYLSACIYQLNPIGDYHAAHSNLFTYLRYNAELSLEGLAALGGGYLAKKVSIDHCNGFTA